MDLEYSRWHILHFASPAFPRKPRALTRGLSFFVHDYKHGDALGAIDANAEWPRVATCLSLHYSKKFWD